MKKIILMLTVLLTVLAPAVFAAENSPEPAGADYTTTQGLSALMKSGAPYLLLDVRTPEEFRAGYIPGALNIPYDRLPGALPETPKDTPIVLYCRSGNRAGVAQRALEKAGYTRVFNFGGLSRWTGPVERP